LPLTASTRKGSQVPSDPFSPVLVIASIAAVIALIAIIWARRR
jgi:hypothetical protein